MQQHNEFMHTEPQSDIPLSFPDLVQTPQQLQLEKRIGGKPRLFIFETAWNAFMRETGRIAQSVPSWFEVSEVNPASRHYRSPIEELSRVLPPARTLRAIGSRAVGASGEARLA